MTDLIQWLTRGMNYTMRETMFSLKHQLPTMKSRTFWIVCSDALRRVRLVIASSLNEGSQIRIGKEVIRLKRQLLNGKGLKNFEIGPRNRWQRSMRLKWSSMQTRLVHHSNSERLTAFDKPPISHSPKTHKGWWDRMLSFLNLAITARKHLQLPNPLEYLINKEITNRLERAHKDLARSMK